MWETVRRGAVLLYVAILWLAAWPIPSAPLLGRAQVGAEELLLSAGLRPGMEVFPGIEYDVFNHTSCTTILGRRDREWETLYASECPPIGPFFFRSSFDLTISRMMWAPKLPLLRDPLPALEGAPEALRHVVELADYFCHAGADRDRVVLRWVQQHRNVRDGSFPPVEHHLVCRQECDDPGSLPSCLLRPYEAEAGE